MYEYLSNFIIFALVLIMVGIFTLSSLVGGIILISNAIMDKNITKKIRLK